jgi:hypothetical protein
VVTAVNPETKKYPCHRPRDIAWLSSVNVGIRLKIEFPTLCAVDNTIIPDILIFSYFRECDMAQPKTNHHTRSRKSLSLSPDTFFVTLFKYWPWIVKEWPSCGRRTLGGFAVVNEQIRFGDQL